MLVQTDTNSDDKYIHPESWPNAITSYLAALQHIGICLVTLTFPRLVGETAGLSPSELANYLQLSFLALGVSTLFQTLRTPFSGTGLLIPSCFTLLYVPGALVAAKIGGISAVAGMTITAGLVEIILSKFVRDLRVILPPELIGIVILMIGISLALFALGQMTHRGSSQQEILISFLSLSLIIGISIWGSKNFVTYAALVGMIVGGFVTIASDLISTSVEFKMPGLAFLYWPMDLPSFSSGLIPGILSGAIGCLVRSTGDIVASSQISDKTWKRPDYAQISRGVMADGLGTLFAGLIGVIGTNTYSGSVGLVAASRVAARRVGYFIAAGWVMLAMIPNSTLLLIWLPKGILGATLFFVALFVIRSGINLLSQRLFDTRKTILIGSALALGLSFDNINLKEAFIKIGVSDSVTPLLVAMVSGIFLNLLFRIGVRKTRDRTFLIESNSDKITQFLLESGQAWGARSEVILRASAVCEEVNEYLNGLEIPPKDFNLKIGFNEIMINLEIRWNGLAPDTNLTLISSDEESALDKISIRLMRHHSDSLKVSRDSSGACLLRIQIDDL